MAVALHYQPCSEHDGLQSSWLTPGVTAAVLREQAMELLKRGWPAGEEPRYDADAVLVVCRMRDFRDGLLFLYERMRLYREVLQVPGVARLRRALILQRSAAVDPSCCQVIFRPDLRNSAPTLT
jgi:hypothetical protein